MEWDRPITETKIICMDDSWRLQSDEIVYVGSGRWPYRVMRNGWGDYESQVRVARLDRDVGQFETGEWVSTAHCARLEVGDWVEAMYDIQDGREKGDWLLRGTCWRFLGFDTDGDVELLCNATKHTVFFQDLESLTLI